MIMRTFSMENSLEEHIQTVQMYQKERWGSKQLINRQKKKIVKICRML